MWPFILAWLQISDSIAPTNTSSITTTDDHQHLQQHESQPQQHPHYATINEHLYLSSDGEEEESDSDEGFAQYEDQWTNEFLLYAVPSRQQHIDIHPRQHQHLHHQYDHNENGDLSSNSYLSSDDGDTTDVEHESNGGMDFSLGNSPSGKKTSLPTSPYSNAQQLSSSSDFMLFNPRKRSLHYYNNLNNSSNNSQANSPLKQKLEQGDSSKEAHDSDEENDQAASGEAHNILEKLEPGSQRNKDSVLHYFVATKDSEEDLDRYLSAIIQGERLFTLDFML
jgi:hypothetical protein